MKRIKILFTIATATMFVACSQPSLEDKAKAHLREMAEIMANDPKSLIVQDEQVVFSNDSVCFISYRAKDKNAAGNYTQSICEYYYVRTNFGDNSKPKSDYYGAYCIDDGKGEGQKRVELAVENMFQTVTTNIPDMSNENQERAKINLYYLVASSRAVVDHRQVPE